MGYLYPPTRMYSYALYIILIPTFFDDEVWCWNVFFIKRGMAVLLMKNDLVIKDNAERGDEKYSS